MDLHHLRYFVAVAEEGSVHRASERLAMAPSALSRRILDLEAELRVALFERLGSTMTLSYAGLVFIDYARRILHEMSETAAHFRRLKRGQKDRLRLGLNGIAPQLSVVQALIRSFRSSHQDVELDLPSMGSEGQLEALRQGFLDAGILFTRPEENEELAHIRLASHRFVLALPADHPLTSKRVLALADLQGEDFVFFPRSSGPSIYDGLMANCRMAGLKPRVVQEADGEHALVGLVAAGMGVSFINETISSRQNRPDITTRSVIDLHVEEHLDLTWRRSNQSTTLLPLIELASQAAGTATPL